MKNNHATRQVTLLSNPKISLKEPVDEQDILSEIEEIEQAEKEKLAEAKAKLDELKQKRLDLKKEQDEKLASEKQIHLDNHNHYLKKASECEDIKDEQRFRRWAEDELRLANEIQVDGFDEPLTQPKKTFSERAFKWLFTHFGSWALQVGLLLVVANFCYDKVMKQKEQIMQINTHYAELGQTTMMIAPPLDEKTIQQIWFDKYQLIGDMGFALFMLLVISLSQPSLSCVAVTYQALTL
ncbi:MAG: hypothetical protein MUF12_01960 [Sediminibacterium sp.]|nr:hypothetical protein [Sediminibacterium sp.]